MYNDSLLSVIQIMEMYMKCFVQNNQTVLDPCGKQYNK